MSQTTDPGTANGTTPGQRLTYVWALLSGLTIVTWWLGAEGTGERLDRNVTVTLAVLTLGLIKVRCIIRYFMEVRTAPRWLRHSTDIWLAVLGWAVLTLYLV